MDWCSHFCAREALLTLLICGCGAKTGLLIPTAACPRGVPSVTDASCGYVERTPYEQPVQRAVRRQALSGDSWCAHAVAGSVVGLAVPEGFCLSLFARLRGVRVMAFGAAGELFPSSPSVTTPSGSTADGWVYRLADGDRDGVAEVQPYLQATDVYGLTLSATHRYFTRTKRVLSTPYSPMLNRADPASVEMVAQIPGDFDGRWTHAVALRADGLLFVTQGRFVVGSEGMVPEIYEVHERWMTDVA